MILASTLFETEVKIATKIRREKNENCVEFSFHSISGSQRDAKKEVEVDAKLDIKNNELFTHF